MPTLTLAPHLWTWTLTLESGEVRHVFGSSLAAAIMGTLPSPIVTAARGQSLDTVADSEAPPLFVLMVPTEMHIDGPDFVLSAKGRGFRPDSVVWFNGTQRPTVFVSENELQTPIHPPGEPPITEAIGVPVLVQHQNAHTRSGKAGESSNTLTFTVLPSAPG